MKKFGMKIGAGKILLILWMLFSVPFTAWALWQFSLSIAYTRGVQVGFQQGNMQTISNIVRSATNKDCKSFSLSLGKNQKGEDMALNLINTACLQQTNSKNNNSSSSSPKSGE